MATKFLPIASLTPNALLYNSASDFGGFAGSASGSTPIWNAAAAAFADSVRAWGIGVTSTTGLSLTNTTPAALGAQQWAPALELGGRGWATDSSTSKAVSWRIEGQTTQGGAAPAGNFYIKRSVDGGAYANHLYLNENGVGGFANLYLDGASGTISAESYSIANLTNYSTGLTTGPSWRQSGRDGVMQIINATRTDAANNICIASCYDRGAAAITNLNMRIHSFGWTNDANTYTELACVYANGNVWAALGLSCAGDIGTAIAGTTTLSNATIGAGAQTALMTNQPATYSNTATWAQHYHNGVKGVIPFFPVV